MNCRNYLFSLVLLTISTVYIQCSDNQIEDQLKNLNLDEFKKNLPAGIEIPGSLQNVTLPTLDDIKKVMKDKCQKVTGNEDAYNAIVTGADELKSCTSGLIDAEVLREEIEKAQPNGELDTVFNKYCRKRDVAIKCMENFTSLLEPCLQPKEIEGKRTFVKIFKNLLNFVCYKDGDQIALFIAEKGPECFDERKDDLIHCMNETFRGYLPEKELETKELPTELPELVMGASQCNDMDTLQVCVVRALEECEESTPANLVESMFKFVRNETPCVNISSPAPRTTNPNKNTNDARSSTVSSVLIASLLAFITVRSVSA